MTVFESRLKCLDGGSQSEVQNMIDANTAMFELSAQMKFQLPWHKLYKTPIWRKLVQAEECVLQ